MISPQCSKTYGWVNGDLGATGAWLINTYRSKRQDMPDITTVPKPTPGTTERAELSANPSVTGRPSAGMGEKVLVENLGENETYYASDMDWFTNGTDEDEITLIYTCTDSKHANWGIMGWGATVDGEWKDGMEYNAGSPAAEIVTKTMTLGALKDSLGVNGKEEVNGLQITVYNGGKIVSLSVKSAASATENPEESSAPVSTPEGSPSEDSSPSMVPTLKPSENTAADGGEYSEHSDGDVKGKEKLAQGENTGKTTSEQWVEGSDDRVAIQANTPILNRKIRALWSSGNIKVSWSRVRNLSGCEIYIKKSGAKQSEQYLAGTVKGWKKNTFKIKKINGKKLNPSDVYEVTVKVNNFLKSGKKVYVAKGLVLHTVSNTNKKYTNVKKVTLSARKITLKKGKTKKIKAKLIRQKKKKKLLLVKHTKSLRYLSSNQYVAKVDSKGRIKAVGKGICTINVIALNGVNREIRVQVK